MEECRSCLNKISEYTAVLHVLKVAQVLQMCTYHRNHRRHGSWVSYCSVLEGNGQHDCNQARSYGRAFEDSGPPNSFVSPKLCIAQHKVF